MNDIYAKIIIFVFFLKNIKYKRNSIPIKIFIYKKPKKVFTSILEKDKKLIF